MDDRVRYREAELPQQLRPRSRSPLRNGSLDRSKTDLPPGLDRRLDDKVGSGSGVKVKEEEILAAAERDKLLQTSFLGLAGHPPPPHAAAPPPLSLSLLERSRMLPPHHYLPGLEPRPPAPSPSLWNPFDKTSELNHRLEMERAAAERERMAVLSRLSGPLALMEHQERLKEQMIREHHERELELSRRQYLERLPPYERERLTYEKFRSESLAVATLSPFSPFNHPLAKSGSPATLPPGVPPPLIPSASATAPTAGPSRSHDNSPSSSKTKGYSAADSTSDLKDKRDSIATDADTHSVR